MSPTKVGPEQHTNAAAADVAPDSQFSTQISGLLLSVRETLRLCQFDEIIEDNLCMLLLNLEEFCLINPRPSESIAASVNRRKALSKRKKTLRKQRLAAQLKYQRPKDLYPILACLGEPDYDAYVRRSIRLFQLPQLKLKGQTLIQNLQSFADSLTRSEATKEAGTHRRSDLSVDFEAAVREIYGFFDAWGRCCEKLLPSKLRLRIQDTGDAAKPAFIFLLTTHPHQSNLMKDGRSWKEINMSMVPPDPTQFHTSFEMDRSNSFCAALLTSSEQDPLLAHVSGSSIKVRRLYTPEKHWHLGHPSITLKTVLENYHIDPKSSLTLAFLLSRAVWQFYGTGWMNYPWSTTDVWFLHERRTSVLGVYMDEPFITPHREETGGQATTQGSTEIPHEYLELRALGIILLEIFLGDVFRNEMQEIAPRSFWGRRVAAAIQILRRDDIGAWSTIGPTAGTVLKGVIHTCIQPQDLYAYAAEHGRFRKAIYRRIVNPLLRLIRERYCEPHEDANNATSNYPAILKSGGGPSIADSRAIPNSLALQTVGQTAGSEIASHLPHPTSDQWFTNLGVVSAIISPIEDEPSPIRIAILDCGVVSSEYVTEYKDFVLTGNTVPKDEPEEHGTKVLRCTRKVIEGYADIYVGRVFRTREANKDTPRLMAEALQWAHKVVHADVIVLPSGFRQRHKEIVANIEAARRSGTLIFAAASNSGGIHGVTFPARLVDDVFCIFATDGNVKASSGVSYINPSPEGMSSHFAFLGQHICLNSTDRLEDWLTGTSFATGIAAGFAARLLHFSRQPGCGSYVTENLPLFRGMKSVLNHLAERAGDNNYKCVRPWKFLDYLNASQSPEDMRESIREQIAAALRREIY